MAKQKNLQLKLLNANTSDANTNKHRKILYGILRRYDSIDLFMLRDQFENKLHRTLIAISPQHIGCIAIGELCMQSILYFLIVDCADNVVRPTYKTCSKGEKGHRIKIQKKKHQKTDNNTKSLTLKTICEVSRQFAPKKYALTHLCQLRRVQKIIIIWNLHSMVAFCALRH